MNDINTLLKSVEERYGLLGDVSLIEAFHMLGLTYEEVSDLVANLAERACDVTDTQGTQLAASAALSLWTGIALGKEMARKEAKRESGV